MVETIKKPFKPAHGMITMRLGKNIPDTACVDMQDMILGKGKVASRPGFVKGSTKLPGQPTFYHWLTLKDGSHQVIVIDDNVTHDVGVPGTAGIIALPYIGDGTPVYPTGPHWVYNTVTTEWDYVASGNIGQNDFPNEAMPPELTGLEHKVDFETDEITRGIGQSLYGDDRGDGGPDPENPATFGAAVIDMFDTGWQIGLGSDALFSGIYGRYIRYTEYSICNVRKQLSGIAIDTSPCEIIESIKVTGLGEIWEYAGASSVTREFWLCERDEDDLFDLANGSYIQNAVVGTNTVILPTTDVTGKYLVLVEDRVLDGSNPPDPGVPSWEEHSASKYNYLNFDSVKILVTGWY